MEEHDLGNGWSFSFFREKNSSEPTGLIICGPAAPQCKYKSNHIFDSNLCCGGVHFENSKIAENEGRPRWKVDNGSILNLTLSPSIECGCKGQHGYIRNGKYESVL